MIDIDDFLDLESKKISQDDAKQDFELPRGDLQGSISSIRKLISQNKLQEAERLYELVRKELEGKRAAEKIKFYNELSKINRDFVERLNKLSSEVDHKLKIIEGLVEKGLDHLRKKDLEAAKKLYSEAHEVYSDLPDEFLSKRVKVQNMVFSFYKELKDACDRASLDEFNQTFNRINSLINRSNSYVKERKLDRAIELYKKCVSLYEALPHGFIQQKAELYNAILKLHEEINISLDIMHLQNELWDLQKPSFDPVQDKPIVQGSRPFLRKVSKEIKEIEKTEHQLDSETRRLIIERKKDRGIYEMSRGFYQEAYNDFSKILAMDPSNREVQELMDKVSSKIQATSSEPPEAAGSSRSQERAIFELEKGFKDKAADSLNRIIKHDPGNREAIDMLKELSKE